MREIKFRALETDGCWCYWSITDPIPSYIMDMINWDTLGQYIGLKDKNGKEIYEGDIVRGSGLENRVGVIVFNVKTFICRGENCSDYLSFFLSRDRVECEIIGNIYIDKKVLVKEVIEG